MATLEKHPYYIHKLQISVAFSVSSCRYLTGQNPYRIFGPQGEPDYKMY